MKYFNSKVIMPDMSMTQYFKGVLCRKNLTNKRMIANFEKPKIMII